MDKTYGAIRPSLHSVIGAAKVAPMIQTTSTVLVAFEVVGEGNTEVEAVMSTVLLALEAAKAGSRNVLACEVKDAFLKAA